LPDVGGYQIFFTVRKKCPVMSDEIFLKFIFGIDKSGKILEELRIEKNFRKIIVMLRILTTG